MQEYLLLIRNPGDGKTGLTPEEHRQFLTACEVYIEKLGKNGHLKRAQPLLREGKMVKGSPGSFQEGPYSESEEIIVGYYQLFAKDLNEATALARENPEFSYVKGAKIEVRPVKMKEESTAYVYPS
jgi:hypothetical protein